VTSPEPRVAMFVLNTCHADARVLKEAGTLSEAGYDVRIFALGNPLWPGGVWNQDGRTIHRLEITSFYVQLLRSLSGRYRTLRSREAHLARLLMRSQRRLRAGADVGSRGVGLVVLLLTAPLSLPARAAVRALTALSARLDAERDDVTAKAEIVENGSLRGRLRRGAGTAARRARRDARLVALRSRRHAAQTRRYSARSRRRLRRHLRLWFLRWRRARARAVRALYLVVYRRLRRSLLPLHRPSVFMRFWRESAEAATAWRPDVVHAHDLNTLPGAARVADTLGIPLVYDSHELWRRRNRHGELRPLGRTVDAVIERRLIRRCTAVITVSDSIARWLERTYRLRSDVVVLRNVPSRTRPSDAPSLRELASLDASARILVYTGRITSGRGIEEAIGALPMLDEAVHLVMLGYGPDEYVEGLLAQARALGVESRVRLAGAVRSDQVSATAAQADAAIVAIQPTCLSYEYCLPNKLFEAIQAGLPVIASDLPDMTQVVSRYGVGESFVLADSAALAVAVRRVLADSERYRAAAAAAAEALCWENERSMLLEAYERLSASRQAADVPSLQSTA
jgi:glycosyltransferase involved in cell wall biosynthesis